MRVKIWSLRVEKKVTMEGFLRIICKKELLRGYFKIIVSMWNFRETISRSG